MMYNSLENVSSSDHSTVPYPLLHHLPPHPLPQHPIMIPLPQPPYLPPFDDGGGGDGGGGDGASSDEFPTRDERFTQWGYQETLDFIEIRAQLEWDFTISKRNKNLWEMVANRMRENGYQRTLEQCKCKWKNLVNRYKSHEASDPDNICQQFPFFDELHAYFAARDYVLQQAQLAPEPTPMQRKKRLADVSVDQSHEGYSLEHADIQEETELIDQPAIQMVAPKRMATRSKRQKTEKHVIQSPGNANNSDSSSVLASVKEVLRNFMEQQQQINMMWKDAMERQAQVREVFRHEWRQMMEKLERERMIMEHAWRERDEQRRLREERRAEQRDALLNTLLNKLIHEENP